jgi:outer membrane protein W
MKKLLLFSAFLGFALTARSQSEAYKSFKVDIGFGYAIPAESAGTKGGVTFTIQPHYRVSDDLALGLRLEGAALAYQTSGTGDTKVSVLASYAATGEYYLADGGIRPFIGAGAGLFTRASIDVGSGSTTVTVPSATKFGFFPTVGIEAGHFRLAADYNILPDKGGYLAFKIGFFLGGGKK